VVGGDGLVAQTVCRQQVALFLVAQVSLEEAGATVGIPQDGQISRPTG
jgi:hypothetical protein